MAVDNYTNESNNNDTDNTAEDIVSDPNVITDGVENQPSAIKEDKKLLQKLKKKWPFIVAGVVVLLIALLFAPIYPKQLPKVSELQPIKLNDVSLATKFESSKALVQKSIQDLGGMVKEATENDGSYGLDANGLAVYKLPYHTLKGKQFSVQPTEAYGIAFDGDIDQSDVNYQKLVTFFDTNNFVQLASKDGQKAYIGEDKAVNFVSYAVYVSSEQLCAIWRANTTVIAENNQRVSVGCATQVNYENAANAVAPFYDTYSKTDGKHDSTLVFGAPDIYQGANGYRRAFLYQEDSLGADQANSGKYTFQAIYYQVPNSKAWKYFGRVADDTDELIECSKVNTDVLRQSFNGLYCFDKAANKNLTIQ